MSLVPCCPCAYAVVRSDEVITDKHGIVAIRDPSYHLAIDGRSAVSALIVCTERF
jgi:hypothetical protein